MDKMWYVFDQFDCFTQCNEAADAAVEAAHLVKEGMTGVHVIHMTRPQFDHYVTHDDLKAALKV
jgi:hypothetical protein